MIIKDKIVVNKYTNKMIVPVNQIAKITVSNLIDPLIFENEPVTASLLAFTNRVLIAELKELMEFVIMLLLSW
jgi:hypothetical protein